MQQNQWLAERLNAEHKRELMAQAEKARQAQFVQELAAQKQSSNLLEKLRSDLMNLAQKSQSDANKSNR